MSKNKEEDKNRPSSSTVEDEWISSRIKCHYLLSFELKQKLMTIVGLYSRKILFLHKFTITLNL